MKSFFASAAFFTSLVAVVSSAAIKRSLGHFVSPHDIDHLKLCTPVPFNITRIPNGVDTIGLGFDSEDERVSLNILTNGTVENNTFSNPGLLLPVASSNSSKSTDMSGDWTIKVFYPGSNTPIGFGPAIDVSVDDDRVNGTCSN